MRTSRIISLFAVLIILLVALTFNSCKEKEPLTVSTSQCPPTITDPRDGQVYPTVQIGNQCWLQKNMNYATEKSWCLDNNSDNCAVYGRLYDWDTLMNGNSSSNSVPSGIQGVCPPGWHVPSDAEWTILIDFLGGDSVAGGKMKETGTGHWLTPNAGATNSSGFTALPGGYRHSSDYFDGLRMRAHFWSSSQYDARKAWAWRIHYNTDRMYRIFYFKSWGFSCRCLKD